MVGSAQVHTGEREFKGIRNKEEKPTQSMPFSDPKEPQPIGLLSRSPNTRHQQPLPKPTMLWGLVWVLVCFFFFTNHDAHHTPYLILYHNHRVIATHSSSAGHNPGQEAQLLRLCCSDCKRNTIGESSAQHCHL